MIKVNPPPQLVLPESFKNDIGVVNYFAELDRVLLQLWTRTGGATDAIAELGGDSQTGFNAMTQELFKRIGSGLEFTIDTTGFTFDSTEITFDKVIA